MQRKPLTKFNIPRVRDMSPTAIGHFQLDGAPRAKRKEFGAEETEVLTILGGS